MVDIEVESSDFFFLLRFPVGSGGIKDCSDFFYRWSLLHGESISGVFLNINNREMRELQALGDSLVRAVVEEAQAIGGMTTFGDVRGVDSDDLLMSRRDDSLNQLAVQLGKVDLATKVTGVAFLTVRANFSCFGN